MLGLESIVEGSKSRLKRIARAGALALALGAASFGSSCGKVNINFPNRYSGNFQPPQDSFPTNPTENSNFPGNPTNAGNNTYNNTTTTTSNDTTTTPVCGNGVVESGEQCDGTNLNSTTCADLSYYGGTLSCNPNCTFNTTSCTVGPGYNINMVVVDSVGNPVTFPMRANSFYQVDQTNPDNTPAFSVTSPAFAELGCNPTGANFIRQTQQFDSGETINLGVTSPANLVICTTDGKQVATEFGLTGVYESVAALSPPSTLSFLAPAMLLAPLDTSPSSATSPKTDTTNAPLTIDSCLSDEGHGLFSKKYQGDDNTPGNKYAQCDTISFTMFGDNKCATATIDLSFLVTRLINGNDPDPNYQYWGRIPTDAIAVPNNGELTSKNFTFSLPCSWPTYPTPGTLDMYAVFTAIDTNGDSVADTPLHRLETFFIVPRTVLPVVSGGNGSQHQETYDGGGTGAAGMPVTYFANVTFPVQPSTVPALEPTILQIQPIGQNCFDGFVNRDDGSPTYATTICGYLTLDYPYSGHYYGNVTAADQVGNVSYPLLLTTDAWITESEADSIAEPIYQFYFGFDPASVYPWRNVYGNSGTASATFDRYPGDGVPFPGDDYIIYDIVNGARTTPTDEIAGTTPSAVLQEWQASYLNARIYGPPTTCVAGASGPYVLAIFPSTASEYTTTITNYLQFLKCNASCSMTQLSGGTCP